MSPNPTSTGSPKTSSAGILVLLAGLFGLLGQVGNAINGKPVDVQAGIGQVTSIATGAGLIAAQDQKKR